MNGNGLCYMSMCPFRTVMYPCIYLLISGQSSPQTVGAKHIGKREMLNLTIGKTCFVKQGVFKTVASESILSPNFLVN